MQYEIARDEAYQVWQRDGAKATICYLEAVMSEARPETRARLTVVRANFTKRTQDFAAAAHLYAEAIATLDGTPYLIEALCGAADNAIELNQPHQALELCAAAIAVIESSPTSEILWWKPIVLNNQGRAYGSLARYAEAEQCLVFSARLFRESDRVSESQNVRIYLAETHLNQGAVSKCISLCKEVKCEPCSEYILSRLESLLARAYAVQGQTKAAERSIDAAINHITEHIGKQDVRLMSELLMSHADVEDCLGHQESAARLRKLARRFPT